jgi:hypothetical protein
MDMFSSDFDPLGQLMAAENNINQLAQAYNNHEAVIQELRRAYMHQQEVIKQLMFQNKKLQELNQITRIEITRLGTEIELLKIK